MSRTKKSRRHHRLLRGFIVGGIVFLVGLAAHYSGFLQPLEWKSWDLRLRWLAEPQQGDKDIVLILIDQYSLDVFEKHQGLGWPWPRQIYAALINYLHQGGARAVFLDFIFSEGSSYGVADDQYLAKAMKAAGNVFLPLSLSSQEEFYQEVPPEVLSRLAFPPERLPSRRYPPAQGVSLPLPLFLTACQGAGNVFFRPDADGIFRRLPLAFSFKEFLLPALPLALAEATGASLSISWKHLPLDDEGRLIIRYHGPAGTYRAYSAAAIINSWAQLQEGQPPQVPPVEFEDKIVLVGASAPGLLDLRPTPLSPVAAGVEIHAAALDNLLHGDWIRPQPEILFLCLLVFFAFFVSILISLLTRVWWQGGGLVVALVLPLLAAWLGFQAGFWVEVVVFGVVIILGFILASLLNYAFEGRQRRFIRSVFSHYLSPQVIARIVEDPAHLRLGGESREITSFFSDLAGFTSISETMTPEELVSFLNELLSEITDIILEEGGTLDKYEGDAIIAFWNAPLEQPDHALRAGRAALQAQRRLAELRPVLKEKYGKDVFMRIGLNSGPAVVGNMGSKRRFDYTAIGDTVNLASRLEGACKIYRVPILIGESTAVLVRQEFLLREVDVVRVVGKTTPVRIYEIIAEKEKATPQEEKRVRLFEEALRFYREKAWSEAKIRFELLQDDPLARLYVHRCQEYIKHPPPPDFDGVFVLESK
jgi:adenylate cyclase